MDEIQERAKDTVKSMEKIQKQTEDTVENEVESPEKDITGNTGGKSEISLGKHDVFIGKRDVLIGKSDSPIIEGIDIVRTFKMGEVQVRALRSVNVRIRHGEFIVIMGPSGSGKTTLLNQLGLLDTPNSGKVIIDNKDTSRMSDREKGKFRLHNLGYVFQDYALLPELNAMENVYISLMMQGKSKAECESAAAEILAAVGLGDRLQQLPSKMSGGQQQRVSIARALAHSPRVLFADEPCANLDSETSKEVLDLFEKFNKEKGQTIVMVTHEEWHAEYADRVIRLKDGIVQE